MRLMLLGAAGLLDLPPKSFASEKLSKQQAQYQDSPNGIQMCTACTLFVAPHACTAVDGDISPNGWCKLYAMAD